MRRHLSPEDWDRLRGMVRAGVLMRTIVPIPMTNGPPPPHLDPIDLPIPPAGWRWETDTEYCARVSQR